MNLPNLNLLFFEKSVAVCKQQSCVYLSLTIEHLIQNPLLKCEIETNIEQKYNRNENNV